MDDELSIQRTSYTGNQLRIDGYYYHEQESPEKLTIYFLYSNGVILLAGDHYDMSNRSEFENTFTTNEFIEKLKGIKFTWGVFDVERSSVAFERWYPSERPYKAYVRAGEILNDTTFIINESYRVEDGKKTELKERNETYHFRQFSPKPDSTNSFIN